MELNPDGTLRFKTVLLMIARQNGKSVIANIVALWRLYIDGARTVVSTAQDLSTATKLWNEAILLIQNDPMLNAQVKKITGTNGDKGIKFTRDRLWQVSAANRSAGRGLSVDQLNMDEFRELLDHEAWAALSNTVIARDGYQILALSNAGDHRSVVLNELRASAITAIDDPETELGIFEWSAEEGCDLDDRNAWAQANPSLGYGAQNEKTMILLRQRQTDTKFRTENLCQYVEIEASGPWDEGIWEALEDTASAIAPESKILISVDVSHKREMTYIAAAGWRADGLPHVEIIAQRESTEWVVPLLTEKFAGLGALAVAIQGRGAPATSLIEHLEAAGIPVMPIQGSDLGSSTGLFYEAVREGRIRHIPHQGLDTAAASAVIKPLGGVWVWDRAASPTDAAPLVAVTQAYYALTVAGTRKAGPATSIYETEDLAWG
jgi:hypothetical protein